MRASLEWEERGGDVFLDLDAPGAPGGGRYLAVRRGGDEDLWHPGAVLVAGEPERELADAQPGLGLAQEVAVKLAIQLLARIHGISPAPGAVEDGAPEPERLVAALWALLAARFR